jgi:hypothetical protein
LAGFFLGAGVGAFWPPELEPPLEEPELPDDDPWELVPPVDLLEEGLPEGAVFAACGEDSGMKGSRVGPLL